MNVVWDVFGSQNDAWAKTYADMQNAARERVAWWHAYIANDPVLAEMNRRRRADQVTGVLFDDVQ